MEKRILGKYKVSKEERQEQYESHIKKKDKYMQRNSGGYSLVYPTEDTYYTKIYDEILNKIRDNWNNITLRKKKLPKKEDTKKIINKKKELPKTSRDDSNKDENKPKPELKSIIDRLY